jgi:hypothetical protein
VVSRTVSGSTRASRRAGRRRRRWPYVLVVIVVLLVALDFVSRAVAENVMASKIEQQGLPHKPSVSIGGFPFLTQVASRDFQQITISTTDVPEGPVTISSINATGKQIKLSSYAFSSGTITSLSGTALISFGSLANTLVSQVGPLGTLLNGAGLNLTDAGPSEVKATFNLLVTSGSATWRVTRLNGNKLNIALVGSSGVPKSVLGSISDITLNIPKLPLGLTIGSVQVTPAGVLGQVSGKDVPFGS